jgi:hypothetical protein
MSGHTKMLELTEKQGGKILEAHVSGKLEQSDYEAFGPRVEQLVQQHGKLRILLCMHDFEGWSASGLWEDIKFDVKHFNDVEKVAMVGEKKWEKGMAIVCKPFTTATVRFFERSELDSARQWLEQD